MNKELWINAGVTFIVVIGAMYTYNKLISPNLG